MGKTLKFVELTEEKCTGANKLVGVGWGTD